MKDLSLTVLRLHLLRLLSPLDIQQLSTEKGLQESNLYLSYIAFDKDCDSSLADNS